MKSFKLILILASLSLSLVSRAQILRAEELEEYAMEKYGKNWVEAATYLSESLVLDKNKALTYVQVIEAPGKTAEQLYINLNHWYTSTFVSGESVIELNDKESGIIIAKGFVEDIAIHSAGLNKYNVSLTPVIRTDIKDEKVRVIYTVPFYSVRKVYGGGATSILIGPGPVGITKENWPLDECFPFVKKDGHKKTSSKSLVMAHAYSNVIMDKIEEAVKDGMLGIEEDNW
ncbi:MAG: DUF4468 domain-containing protein [Bacteroidaceae bacterium]|nr:DUF4468 domain-containing protein [Bacteroidaceae bacterium]